MLPTPSIDFQRTPVTLTITAVALAIELVCTFDPDGGRRMYLYNELQLGIWGQVWEGELWRPFTTTLLHGSLMHAAFNIYWMITLGTAIENRIGSPRFLATIVVVAYVSTMGQFYFLPNGVVGLSGVVYGLFGLMWIGRRYVPEWAWTCNDDTVRLMFGWFFFCFAISYLGMPIANLAHAFGLAMGATLGGAAYDRRHRRMWSFGAALLVAACVAVLIAAPGNSQYEIVQKRRAQRESRQIDVNSLREIIERPIPGTNIRLKMVPLEHDKGVRSDPQSPERQETSESDQVDDDSGDDGV